MFGNEWRMIPLSVLSVFLLCSCTARTILHGMKNLPEPSGSSSAHQVNVFFVKGDQDGLKLVPVSRIVSGNDRLQAAVSALLSGPDEAESGRGLGSEIPRGTILLSVKRRGTDVELDLSRRFASGGGVESLETRLEQLRRTVRSAEKWHNVYLSVEGNRLTIAAGEGIEVHQPINR